MSPLGVSGMKVVRKGQANFCPPKVGVMSAGATLQLSRLSGLKI